MRRATRDGGDSDDEVHESFFSRVMVAGVVLLSSVEAEVGVFCNS
jgi:hypothetical protein